MGITQVFPKFYEEAPKNGAPLVGEFFWVPCPDPAFKVLECTREYPEATMVYEVRLANFNAAVHFRPKDKLPNILVKDENQEALMQLAKCRPCLVLGCAAVANLNTLNDKQQERQAKALELAHFLVAPLYSCASPAKPTQFTTRITARVKALYYPHFAYMPDFAGHEPGSILRLDRIFATTLGVGMTRVGKRLHPEVLNLVYAQLAEVLGLGAIGELRELLETTRAIVKDCPPEGLA